MTKSLSKRSLEKNHSQLNKQFTEASQTTGENRNATKGSTEEITHLLDLHVINIYEPTDTSNYNKKNSLIICPL